MKDTYDRGLYRQGSGLWRSLRDGDFEEEDVWDVLKDRKDSTSIYESSLCIKKKISSTATASKIRLRNVNNEVKSMVTQQQSAPMNVPDWSKMSTTINKSKFENKEDDEEEQENEVDYDPDGCNSDYDGLDNSYCNGMVPPHEIIARRLARSQISSFSVFEGAGRTLKGRDLSKVRNAVLTKTGFLESF